MSKLIEEFLAGRDAVADFTRCRGYLQSALDLIETHTMGDIIAGIERGAFHFWPGQKSAAITEVYQYPRARYLNIFLAGGDLDELLSMVPLFKSWGEHLGCTELVLAGRPGWEKVLKGWTRRAVVLSTQIEKGSN